MTSRTLSIPLLLIPLSLGAPDALLAQAAQTCSSGRAANGACADGPLTASMQQRALVFSQSKISYLGFPLASNAGAYVDAARDRNSLSYGIDKPVVTTPVTTPPPGSFVGLPNNVNPASLNIAAPYTIVPGGIRFK